MSEPVSPLGGASFKGFATLREIGPQGMITLRAAPKTKGLAAAVKAAVGSALPEQRRIALAGDRFCAWMSPDEYLLWLPHGEVATALATLSDKLSGQHHMAVDVTDARAVFRIEGARADQVLRKLSPADLDTLAPGEIRRTRIAQVPAAFWKDEEGFTLVAFRSVAGYVMALLSQAARQGGEID